MTADSSPSPYSLLQEELARRLEARESLLPFTELFTPDYIAGWVHREVAELLDAFRDAVERKLSPRLMIFLPPRCGKSQLVSRLLPPFLLGHNPHWEVVAASSTQDLSDSFGRYVRSVLNSPVYQDLFPAIQLDPSTNSASLVQTQQRGMYKAVGVGGQLTGMGAHALIIDDPIKDREQADSPTQREALWDWYSSVARTRLHPGGGIIVLHTRWHEDDLAGKLITQMRDNPDADQWKIYSYPAIAKEDETHRKAGEALHPERYPIQALHQIRNSILMRDWTALYQQDPSPDDGDYFKREWFNITSPSRYPDLSKCSVYISTDLAVSEKTSADYSVIWPFAVDENDDLWFLSDYVRERLSSLDIVEAIFDRVKRYDARGVIIEKGQIASAIRPIFNKRSRERQLYTELIEPAATKDKQTRARSLQGRMQQRRVHYPDLTPFHEHVLPEFLMFPNGKHDDAVDTCAWAALALDDLITPSKSAPPPQSLEEQELEQWNAELEKQNEHKPHVPDRLIPKRRKTERPRNKVIWVR